MPKEMLYQILIQLPPDALDQIEDLIAVEESAPGTAGLQPGPLPPRSLNQDRAWIYVRDDGVSVRL